MKFKCSAHAVILISLINFRMLLPPDYDNCTFHIFAIYWIKLIYCVYLLLCLLTQLYKVISFYICFKECDTVVIKGEHNFGQNVFFTFFLPAWQKSVTVTSGSISSMTHLNVITNDSDLCTASCLSDCVYTYKIKHLTKKRIWALIFNTRSIDMTAWELHRSF